MRLKRLATPRNGFLAGGLLLAALIPVLIGRNQYTLVLACTVLLYSVLSTGWNLIGGLGGQLDLGAWAYVGLGAFTTGSLLGRLNITPWLGMPLGGLVAMAVAALVGLPLFRFKVRGVWYALSSSALVQVLYTIFMMWTDVGGPMNRYLPSASWSWYNLRFNTYYPYYYLLLALLVVALLINYRVRHTKLGYQLLALGESEEAAEVLGVDARSAKLKALMIYAFLSGVTGGIYTCIYGFYQAKFFDSNLSTEIAILGIVGGMGITYGPLLAAMVLVAGREFLRANLGTVVEGSYLAVYAVVLIVIVLFRPSGLAVLAQDIYKLLRARFLKRNYARPDLTAGH